MYRQMVLISKQAYASRDRTVERECGKQINNTEVGNGGKVEIYGADCNSTRKCGAFSRSSELEEKNKKTANERAQSEEEENGGVGGGEKQEDWIYNKIYKEKEVSNMRAAKFPSETRRGPSKTSLFTPAGIGRKAVGETISQLPTVPPQPRSQQFYPQYYDVKMGPPASNPAKSYINADSFASTGEIERMLPETSSKSQTGSDFQNLLKVLILESRDEMRLELEEARKSMQDYSHISNANREEIQRLIQGNDDVLVDRLLERISPMLEDSFSGVQQSLQVQKTLIEEHINVQTSIQENNSNMEVSVSNVVVQDVKNIFLPIQNQINVEINNFLHIERNTWIERFQAFKNDVFVFNTAQFQALENGLQANYMSWKNELDADFRQRLEYQQQDWKERSVALVNSGNVNTSLHIKELKGELFSNLRNAISEFNRQEMIDYDDRFKQLQLFISENITLKFEEQRQLAGLEYQQREKQQELPAPPVLESIETNPPPQALEGPEPVGAITGPTPLPSLPPPDPVLPLEGPSPVLPIEAPPDRKAVTSTLKPMLALPPPSSSPSSSKNDLSSPQRVMVKYVGDDDGDDDDEAENKMRDMINFKRNKLPPSKEQIKTKVKGRDKKQYQEALKQGQRRQSQRVLNREKMYNKSRNLE